MGKPGPHTVILTQLAAEILEPAGMFRAGRSRRWWCDCGYFLVEVEFQPHSWRKGTFCNVAVSFLWESPYEDLKFLKWSACQRLRFSRKMRKALGQTHRSFIEYEGDDEVFRQKCLILIPEVLMRVNKVRQMTDLTYADCHLNCIDGDMRYRRMKYFSEMLSKLSGRCGEEVRQEMIDRIARNRERIRAITAYRKLPIEFVVLKADEGPYTEARTWKRRLRRFFMGL
ncbi:MAG: hypothetical protein K2G93_06040 [Rikenella sp.]|nr:hypothetical protein [Rikenella sp.]